MPFLALNGWTIPVADGEASVRPEDIGERERSYSGELLTNVRTRKRSWPLQTPPVNEMTAKAIEGVIEGLGHVWPFDWQDAALLIQDLFSSKGGASVASVASTRFGKGVDGADVVDLNGVDESKFGEGSLTLDLASTNILPADVRDVEGGSTAGFTAVAGGSIALETTNVLQGSQSLEITTAAAADGAETDLVSAAAATTYIASVYVKTAAARAVTLKLFDDIGQIGTVNYTTAAGKWNLLTVSGTTGGGATDIKMQVLDNAAAGTTIYCDAFQIETGSVASTWVDGSRAASDLRYNAGLITSFTDLTYNAWVRMTTANPASTTTLIRLDKVAGTGSFLEIRRDSGANNIDYQTRGPTDIVADTITYAASPWDDAWHMVTATMRTNPETGEVKKELYFDGVSVATFSPAQVPLMSEIDEFKIGDPGVSSLDGALVDDMMLVPFAAPAALVTAWFNAGQAMSLLPRVEMTGDIIPESSTIVEGEVTSMPFLGASVDGVNFIDNARRVEFTIDEV
jgi:hypothetical protein